MRKDKKKNFWVIAYDIANDKRRAKIVKAMEKVGNRVNYSVFECMLTEKQFEKLHVTLEKLIEPNEDSIVCYPLCLGCYTKIIYSPLMQSQPPSVAVVI